LGRKRVFTVGIVVFAAASFACGLAPGVPALIAARVAQGVGGALMIPGSLAMLSTFFGPAERGKAIGTWSAFSVLATAIGPVLGGLLAGAGFMALVFFVIFHWRQSSDGVDRLKIPARANQRRNTSAINPRPPANRRGPGRWPWPAH